MELWLVRHGEATNNAADLVTGGPESELTELGRRQAHSLGKWIKNSFCFTPSLIVTSEMKRAIETQELLGFDGDVIRFAELNETNAGLVSYWTRKKFDATYPEFWNNFNPHLKFPEGESHMDLYSRVNTCIEEILKKSQAVDKILIVAHGGTINCILHKAFKIPMEQWSRFKLDNASLSILEFQHTKEMPILCGLNFRPNTYGGKFI